MLTAVITTIQKPTFCMRVLDEKLGSCQAQLIVIGDKKGPNNYKLSTSIFLDIAAQERLKFRLASKLPFNSYARKNIGYLHAMKLGASCIYETDDDNKPNAIWGSRTEYIKVDSKIVGHNQWVNVYKYFTSEHIWPRGLPLNEITSPSLPLADSDEIMQCPIQQGLVDQSPDVDAIWRLIMDKPFFYDNRKSISILVPPTVWSPFNTQSTWWWPLAYPLMYIPSFCSFRMCDIWKSFVAQRCLWELGLGVVYHSPEVVQERNYHDLQSDFEDEVPGYVQNRKLCNHLATLRLKPGPGNILANLFTCYQELVDIKIFPAQELELVEAWCHDIQAV